ncbi:unnamed protein product [Ceratitis capitata]|uniref:(Mediterranean fruit fly) hypothetical protein n=1 Tax=Ceratitis capitata TaxID=7213 RepID=A0A811UF85_CERCA|nr:unnamed protein product [Ceratitis capitata]
MSVGTESPYCSPKKLVEVKTDALSLAGVDCHWVYRRQIRDYTQAVGYLVFTQLKHGTLRSLDFNPAAWLTVTPPDAESPNPPYSRMRTVVGKSSTKHIQK